MLYSDGPSGDPEFYFIKNGSTAIAATIYGANLALPGDGTAYTYGQANHTFFLRSKYRFSNGSFKDVPQPYYYVGLKTKTLAPIRLMSAPVNGELVAELPKGAAIEVLLSDDKANASDEVSYLVKDSVGLVGWVMIKQSQHESNIIDGIYFAGD